MGCFVMMDETGNERMISGQHAFAGILASRSCWSSTDVN